MGFEGSGEFEQGAVGIVHKRVDRSPDWSLPDVEFLSAQEFLLFGQNSLCLFLKRFGIQPAYKITVCGLPLLKKTLKTDYLDKMNQGYDNLMDATRNAFNSS